MILDEDHTIVGETNNNELHNSTFISSIQN